MAETEPQAAPSWLQMTSLMTQLRTDRFSRFIALFSQMLSAQPREALLLAQGKELLAELVRFDDWLDPVFTRPDPIHYQPYLLHLDASERFSVVSFVWGPGQSTPIHDHTTWGLVGMLRGSEMCQPYAKMSDGRWAAAGLQLDLRPGDVEVINPRLGDVHRVWNARAEEVSISIHVYGGNIGSTQRSVYTPEGVRKAFVSGYSPVPRGFERGISVSKSRVMEEGADLSNAIPSAGSSRTAALPDPLGRVSEQTPETPAPVLVSPPTVIKSWMSKSAAEQITQLTPVRNAQSQFKPSPATLTSSTTSTTLPINTPLNSTHREEVGAKRPLDLAPPPIAATAMGSAAMGLSTVASRAAAPVVILPSEAQRTAAAPSVPMTSTADTAPSAVPSAVPSSVPRSVPGAAANLVSVHNRPSSQVEATPPQGAKASEPDDPRYISSEWVKARLMSRQELVLVDAREEDPFAKAHPLFASNFPLSSIEVDAYRRIPRLSTPIVVYDNQEGLAEQVVEILKSMGYEFVRQLRGGLQGWIQSGGEIFQDVNVPSKSFGELVQVKKQTPKVSAQLLKAWIEQNADVVILDARRFDEYQTMAIPRGVSVPGGELVLRARTLAPKVTTRIVVNCAGRTRSIIGAQSLVNAGIPNPVCALENGTIGWVLAGQALVTGSAEQFQAVSAEDLAKSKLNALSVAIRSGVKRIDREELVLMQQESLRTTYLFDVRTPEEFAQGHLPKAIHAPGGQLVQETDHFAPVRGARVVLYDTDGVRAHMTASWLAQMGWEAFVLKEVKVTDLLSKSVELMLPPVAQTAPTVKASVLKEWLSNRSNLTLVIDVGTSQQYVKAHIPGAWWILRSQMAQDFQRVHRANRYVITSSNGHAAQYAARALRACVKSTVEVLVLEGGTKAWTDAGYSCQQGESYLASPRIDRYQRPYEGTHNSAAAMQAYLDWEFGLVEQLKRDGTHHFKVI